MKKMKKVLASLLAATMVMSMSVTAFAEEKTYDNMSTVKVYKTYKLTNGGTTSPAETFSFTTLTCESVTQAAVGVTKDNAPVPTIDTVSYIAGEAGSETATKEFTITLPEYTGVGIYTYTFSEIDNNTAGVIYFPNKVTLVVTVIEQNGKVRVAAVHTEGNGNVEANSTAKSANFDNEYSAGSLAVTKEVTGLLGDKTKDFNVTVTFTAPTGDTVREAITYIDGTETKTIAAGWSGTEWAEITLKHGETVTFTNIPYGVTYTVEETDYTESDGYDAATYAFADSNKKIDSASEGVKITNNKGGTVDTGIILDSAPYVLLLALAAAGMFAVVNKKREEEF